MPMLRSASSDSIAYIVNSNQFKKECRHTVATAQAASKSPVQINERANATNTNEDWRETINIPRKYDIYHTAFINIIYQFH